MSNKKTVMVLGAGSWGTALALVLARNQYNVLLWDINTELISNIQNEGMNSRFIPGVLFPENLHVIAAIDDVSPEIDLYLMAVPCHALRSCLELLPNYNNQPVCLACKGFEPGTQELNHRVVEQVLTHAVVGVLSGPSFAKEVAKGDIPTAVTIASKDMAHAQQFADYFHNDFFRIYSHDDIIGVQVGGAVKNVMAIAAGIADGLGFGANTRSALITRGLNEITQLGLAMGGRQESFMGLSGLGDLILTCTDDQSRNRRLGLFLAEGLSVQQASDKIGQAIEGIKTAYEVGALAAKYHIEMPITDQVIGVLNGDIVPKQAVHALLTREPRSELS